jgi:hypothetical protein
MAYLSGQEAWYDEDQKLWFSYVGVDDRNKTLAFSAWGRSAEEAKIRASWLMELLNLGERVVQKT